MNRDVFAQRLAEAALSRWELAVLLGIHPHELRGVGGLSGLAEQPVRVLIELARRLDIHPADIVGDLEPLLTNRRAPGVQVVIDSQDSTVDPAGRDATRVLTALASAGSPVTGEDLSAVLGWSLQRTVEVLEYAQAHPELGGPVALRHVPPDAWTVTARQDVLTPAQHQALMETTRYRVPLTEDEATVMLAVLTHRTSGTALIPAAMSPSRDRDPVPRRAVTDLWRPWGVVGCAVGGRVRPLPGVVPEGERRHSR